MAEKASDSDEDWTIPYTSDKIRSRDVITSFIYNKLANYPGNPVEIDFGYKFINYRGQHVEETLNRYLTEIFGDLRNMHKKVDEFYKEYQDQLDRLGTLTVGLAHHYYLQKIDDVSPFDEWSSLLNIICLTWWMMEEAHAKEYNVRVIHQLLNWAVEFFVELKDETVKKLGGWEKVQVMRY